MNNVIVAAVEVKILNIPKSSFEPYGYEPAIDNPIMIPFDNLDTVTVTEGSFEQWTVEARDAEGDIVFMRVMREPIR